MSSLWQWIQRHLRGKKSRAKEERFSLCKKEGIQKVLQHTSLNLTLVQIKEKLGFFLSGSDPYRGGRSAGGVDYKSEKVYMTKDYLDMMWGRNKFQQTILELGYNFLFTDVDILWFRNPMRHIAVASDIAISSDFYVGDPDSLVNFPNGGFLYVRSCEKTVEFYKNWQLCRDKYPGKHEQNVFNQIKGELSVRLKVKILQFLDTAFCGGFCQLAKDLNSVCTMHANCCVGLASKMHDLRSVLEC